MNERDPTGGAGAPLDDDAVARLIQDAGRREPVPPEDLAAIAAAARAAWKARAARASAVDRPVAPETKRRTAPVAALALAAALAAIVAGIGWWAARDGIGSAASARRVATLEAATGSLRIESQGVTGTLAVGGAVPSGAVVHTDDAATAAGVQSSRGALRLASGTWIRLDAGTEVRFESASRLDLLAGALYADTDAAPSAIVIDTLAGTVSDVGTRFIARLVEGSEPADDAPRQAAAPGLVVLVRDGRVSIETGGGSETAGAGERLLVRGDGAVEHRSVRTWGREWDWVLDAAPRFDVAGRSIAEILDWVSRETGWTVRYEDAALGEAARSMMVQASRSEPSTLRADQAAFVLLPGANLEGELDAAGVLTVRRR